MRAIDGVNYNNAINTANITSAITSGINSINSKLDQNKIDALQNQVDAMRLQIATGNVVRYPTSASYSIPVPPVFGTPCGGFGF